MWKDVITLHAKTVAYDDYKRPYDVLTDRVVYANEKSVRFNEFYQAHASGLRAEKIFATKGYQGEEHLTHRGTKYRVIRVFKSGDVAELTCQSLVSESEYS